MTGYNLPMGCNERDLGGGDPHAIVDTYTCETCGHTGQIQVTVFPFHEWDDTCQMQGCDGIVTGYYEPLGRE